MAKDINKIKTDKFGGFNPLEAYTAFGSWFVKTFGHKSCKEITDELLKNPAIVDEFASWCAKTEIFQEKNITPTTLLSAFDWALNYYKVLEVKDDKYVLGINIENRKSEILQKLGKKTSDLTKAEIKNFELEMAKLGTKFINNYIDNQESDQVSSAFDGMFWAMAKKNVGQNNKADAFALFTAFSVYKRGQYVDEKGNAIKKIPELYKLALKNNIKWPGDKPLKKDSSSFKNFMILMSVLGLAKSFSPTETELDLSLIEYDHDLKTYLLKPSRIPSQYPFSQKEVDELLTLMKEKGNIKKSDVGTKKYLGKYANDPRIQKTDVDVLYEALVGFKMLYSFNILPIELYKANFLNFNKNSKGSQIMSIQNVIDMKINTSFDRDLIPYNTAPAGVADIVTKVADIYFTVEPCVYTNEDDILGHETNGVNHIPGNGCMILTTLKELSPKAKQAIVAALCAKNDDDKSEKRLIFATPDNLADIITQIQKDPQKTFKSGYILKKRDFLVK